MVKIDDSFEACEIEAFCDGLEYHLEAMCNEMDCGPGWSAAERGQIAESIRWNDYMELWGEIDPLGAGFKAGRREGA